MSWSIHAMFLRALDAETRDWLASETDAVGRPTTPPAPGPPPTVADVLAAVRAAGGHGEPWFRVGDDVTGLAFRKPVPAAVIPVALALADRAGPVVLFSEDDVSRTVVVSAGDDPADVAGRWPW